MMQQWQPIETAPKDGTLILVWPGNGTGTVPNWPRPVISAYDPRSVSAGSHFGSVDSCCGYYEDLKPTHWMPLPRDPKKSIFQKWALFLLQFFSVGGKNSHAREVSTSK